MSTDRRYTLREALHVLADALADQIGDRDIKPANDVRPAAKKRARAPRRAASGVAVIASQATEANRAAAKRALRQMGVRLPE